MSDAVPIRVKDKIQLRTNITNIATIAAMTKVVRDHQPISSKDVKPYFMAEKANVSKKKKETNQDTQTEPTLALYGLVEYQEDGLLRTSNLGQKLIEMFFGENISEVYRFGLYLDMLLKWHDDNNGRDIHPGLILLKLLVDKDLGYELSDHEFTEFLWDSDHKKDSDYEAIKDAILEFRAKGSGAVSYEVKRSKTNLFLPAFVTTWKLFRKNRIFNVELNGSGKLEWKTLTGETIDVDTDEGDDSDADPSELASTGLPSYSKVTFYSLVPKVFNIVKWRFEMERYLSAIRTKPFILLAGISGTGKSRLVRQLARGCCPDASPLSLDPKDATKKVNKPGNFESIPVRPNWHDSTELLGYVTRITEDKKPKYVLTPFVKFLAKAWMNEEVPFFLCLDEMNLAPVEQYFAEYLSVIESRKKNAAGKVETDVMVRFDVAQSSRDGETKATTENFVKETVAALLEKELASSDNAVKTKAQALQSAWVQDDGIRVPPNLVVIGTVNMDETTCSFSRKVLDRAMTFELNDVSNMYTIEEINEEGDIEYGAITLEAAQSHYLGAKDAVNSDEGKVEVDPATHETVAKRILRYIETVNGKLENTPFKIAYRSRDEIMIYCLERTRGGMVSLAQALDEATSMKILSRIEGDEQKLTIQVPDGNDKKKSANLLEELEKTIKDALKTANGGTDPEPPCKVCADKLAFMRARLDGGFTNFFV